VHLPLIPLLDQIRSNTGRQAQEISAESGYCSEENLKNLARRRIRGYVATGRQKHGESSATRDNSDSPWIQRMSWRLEQGGFRSRYRLRKQVVEPVFGQIKQARGFRQFLLRGQEAVAAEWSLLCTAHNLSEARESVVVNGITLPIVAYYPKTGTPGTRQTALERRELGFIDSWRGFLEAHPAELVRFRVSWTGS